MINAILRVRCQDRTGIIAALSDFVFRHGGNILDLDQHTEPETGRFFMRLVWSLQGFCLDADGIRLGLDVFARSLGLHRELDFDDGPGRVTHTPLSSRRALPGARPYHQAQARGVKLIGATAHYATADLDEGPIIEQDVTRVTHRDTVADMIRKGRDLERQVLA